MLDSDHVSFIQIASGAEFLALQRRMALHPKSEFALCIVSSHEQALGANAFVSRARSREQLVKGFNIFERLRAAFSASAVLQMDLKAAGIYESLRATTPHVKAMDLRIAAVALANDVTLLTRNSVDFGQVPGLRIEDWTR